MCSVPDPHLRLRVPIRRNRGPINDTNPTIDALSTEDRQFPPSDAFKAQAGYDASAYERGEDHEAFWAAEAENIAWRNRRGARCSTGRTRPSPSGSSAPRSTSPRARRPPRPATPDKVAYYWEGDGNETRTITYQELCDEVCRAANALAELGVTKGDRVAIYMGMVPELPVAMLACARLGAAHSVVFGGFSSDSLRDRIDDAEAKVLITCDGS